MNCHVRVDWLGLLKPHDRAKLSWVQYQLVAIFPSSSIPLELLYKMVCLCQDSVFVPIALLYPLWCGVR